MLSVDSYVNLPIIECVCLAVNLFFFFSTIATVFPSSHSHVESAGTDTFNGSQVLARILDLEKVILLSCVTN